MTDLEMLEILEFIGDAISGAPIENKHFIPDQWSYRVRLSNQDVIDFHRALEELRRRKDPGYLICYKTRPHRHEAGSGYYCSIDGWPHAVSFGLTPLDALLNSIDFIAGVFGERKAGN